MAADGLVALVIDRPRAEDVLGATRRSCRWRSTSAARPTEYGAKAVEIGKLRYIVCVNHGQAAKDAADRAAIVESLERRLKRGDKALIGNTGYRRYLKSSGKGRFTVDRDKVETDAKFDGIFVLRTNIALDPLAVMRRYKQLWTVEQVFRTTKDILGTRPIFHKRDETIRGHVFCSFLALVLKKDLTDRLAAHGAKLEWAQAGPASMPP